MSFKEDYVPFKRIQFGYSKSRDIYYCVICRQPIEKKSYDIWHIDGLEWEGRVYHYPIQHAYLCDNPLCYNQAALEAFLWQKGKNELKEKDNSFYEDLFD